MQRNESLDNFWNRSDTVQGKQNTARKKIDNNLNNTSYRGNYNQTQSLYGVRNNMNASYNYAPNNNVARNNYNTQSINNSLNYTQPKIAEVIPMPVERVVAPVPVVKPKEIGSYGTEKKAITEETPINIGNWLFMMLLITIPGINIVALVKWALDDSRPDKQAFSKAFMFWVLVLITFTLVMMVVFYDDFDFIKMIRIHGNVVKSIVNKIIGR